jgi:hypothetical protein
MYGLLACEHTAPVTLTEDRPFLIYIDDVGEVDRLEIEKLAELIRPGMSREAVAEIIGERSASLTPNGFLPLCDSHVYLKDGVEKFIQVFYEVGAKSVLLNAEVKCAII